MLGAPPPAQSCDRLPVVFGLHGEKRVGRGGKVERVGKNHARPAPRTSVAIDLQIIASVRWKKEEREGSGREVWAFYTAVLVVRARERSCNCGYGLLKLSQVWI